MYQFTIKFLIFISRENFMTRGKYVVWEYDEKFTSFIILII